MDELLPGSPEPDIETELVDDAPTPEAGAEAGVVETPAKPTEVAAETPATEPEDPYKLNIRKFGPTKDRIKANSPLPEAPKAKPAERDLSMFDEADRALAKQMSNQAYERVKTWLAERAELKAKLAEPPKPSGPASVYDHPEGYTLQEDYNKALDEVDTITEESELWHQQLVAVRGNKPFRIPQKMQDGKFKLSDQLYEPSPEIDVKLTGILSELNQKKFAAQQAADGIKTTFSNTIAKATEDIDKGSKAAFPWLSNPEEYKTKVFEGPNVPAKTIEQLHKDFEALMPAPYRANTPVLGIAKNLFASVHVLKAVAAQAEARAAAAEAKLSENRTALPSSRAGGAKLPASDAVFTDDLTE